VPALVAITLLLAAVALRTMLPPERGGGGGLYPRDGLVAVIVVGGLLLGVHLHSLLTGGVGSILAMGKRSGKATDSFPGAGMPAEGHGRKMDPAQIAAQLGDAREQLSRAQSNAQKLQQEVDRLTPHANRLLELEKWIWPEAVVRAGSSLALVQVLEATSPRSTEARDLGRRLYARLHLLAAVNEDEPDRCAELLDHLGRDFYRWIDATKQTASMAHLENELIGLAKEAAERCRIDVRRARPGDSVDRRIHDATGSGMVVKHAHSFVLRRRSDGEVIRRALVEV